MDRIINLFFVMCFALISVGALFGAIESRRLDMAFYFVMSGWFAYMQGSELYDELKDEDAV